MWSVAEDIRFIAVIKLFVHLSLTVNINMGGLPALTSSPRSFMALFLV